MGFEDLAAASQARLRRPRRARLQRTAGVFHAVTWTAAQKILRCSRSLQPSIASACERLARRARWKVFGPIWTSSIVGAPRVRTCSGRTEVARSRADWADWESLNEPTWITQLAAVGGSGAAGATGTLTALVATRRGLAGGGATASGGAGSGPLATWATWTIRVSGIVSAVTLAPG